MSSTEIAEASSGNEAPLPLDTILQGDCVELLSQLPDASVDLVFADPPFNIGYEYDEYHDAHSDDDYLAWSEAWITQTHRVLKPSGSFWLAIGDEYAAELRVLAKRLGYTARNWIIWYYTFGQNCKRKFNRSHAHLLHFVKDEAAHTFNADDPEVRVPSARALVYGDRRANPTGRLPDDTWILRPQDLADTPEAFQSLDDTWYFSRVAGTFKERQGFHGCQMPEQLLGRIVRVSSSEGDLVVDPFSGSGTTLAVAKKLGRRWLGFELSSDYVKYGNDRLDQCEVGAPLTGPADPLRSAPSTAAGRKLKGHPLTEEQTEQQTLLPSFKPEDFVAPTAPPALSLREQTEQALTDAFIAAHEGRSVDWLLCDPELQQVFHERCSEAGLIGGAGDWNHELLKLRKRGKLPKLQLSTPKIDSATIDRCGFAAEIAWKEAQQKFRAMGLDELFASASASFFFDRAAAKQLGRKEASQIGTAPIRWATLRLRKAQHTLANEAKQFDYVLRSRDFGRFSPWKRTRFDRWDGVPGVYLLRSSDRTPLYVGETDDLGGRLALHAAAAGVGRQTAQVSLLTDDNLPSRAYRRPLWTDLVRRYTPRLNIAPVAPSAD